MAMKGPPVREKTIHSRKVEKAFPSNTRFKDKKTHSTEEISGQLVGPTSQRLSSVHLT